MVISHLCCDTNFFIFILFFKFLIILNYIYSLYILFMYFSLKIQNNLEKIKRIVLKYKY